MAAKRKQSHGSSRSLRDDSIARDDGKPIVNSYEDVADSEDEFHINRDKILFEEGPAQKRQRRIREEGKRPHRSVYISKIRAQSSSLSLPMRKY